MPSIRPTVPLLATVTLTGALLLTGCGSAEDDSGSKDGGGAASTTAAGAKPADGAAKTDYKEPMDIAKKIRKAKLGCAKPKRAESLGSGKVICGGKDNISIEFYELSEVFEATKETICEMDLAEVLVVDEKQRWMVTSLSTATTKRVHKAIGGKLVKAC